MNRACFALALLCCLVVALPAQAASRTWTATVTNKTCSPIAISVDGRFQEAIPASTFFVVKNLKPGLHTVTVKGCSGSVDREIRVDGVLGDAYEEYACPHVVPPTPQDPYKQTGQSTVAPPAPVIMQYVQPVKVVEYRDSRPVIQIRTSWPLSRRDSRHDYRYDSRHDPRYNSKYNHRH